MTGAAAPRRWAMRAVAALVLGALLVLAVRRLDLQRVAVEVGRARPLWVLAAVACFALILPFWAAQWWLLVARAPRRTFGALLRVIAMTSSVLNTTPLLVGEAAGVYFLVTEAAVDRASALAVLAMDQLLVGVAKVCVLTAAASLLPLPPVMRDGVRALAAAVALLLVLLLTIAWTNASRRRTLSRHLGPRLASIVERVGVALAPLRSPWRAGGGLLLALAKKGCELLAILALQRAFGVALPASSALLVLAALNLATLLPVVPGNAGVFEGAVMFAYVRLGVPAERALGMAVVQHAAYFAALALPGYRWLVGVDAARSAAAAP